MFKCAPIDSIQGTADGSHTAENLASFFKGVLASLGLTGKAWAATCDNAGNFQAGFGEFLETVVRCAGHILHLSVEDGLDAVAEIKKLLQSVKNIVAMFKRSPRMLLILRNAFGKVCPTLKFLKPIQSVATRWNSVFDMLDRFLYLRPAIEHAWETFGYYSNRSSTTIQENKLTNHDWELVKALRDIMQPIKECTVHVSKAVWPTAGMSHMRLKTCLSSLRTEAKKNSLVPVRNWAEAAADKLNQMVNSKTDKKVQEALMLSAFFDPRIKKLKHLEPDDREKIIKLAETMYRQQVAASQVKASTTKGGSSSNDSKSSSSNNSKSSSSSSKMDTTGSGTETKKTESGDSKAVKADADQKRQAGYPTDSDSDDEEDPITQEWKSYLKQKDICWVTGDPYGWWRENKLKFPHLAPLARKYLALPATSTESERLFSAAGFMMNKRRSSLKSDNLNMMLFIRTNWQQVFGQSSQHLAQAFPVPPEEAVKDPSELA